VEEFIAGLTRAADARLAEADAALVRQYPGERPERQPVHTVYVPADRFAADTAPAWGAAARRLLAEHDALFRAVTGADDDLVGRIDAKLAGEPVEDLRIDFEDGLKHVDDEDALARTAAAELTRALEEGSAPGRTGIRFKSLEGPTRARGLRTLALFLDAAGWPDGFGLTLPKVTSVDQVEAMVEVAGRLEERLGLTAGTVGFEIQVETPQSILGPDGTALVARMVQAAAGRCTGLHYGTYDYSAFLGVAAAYQSLEHPAADHAKAVMQAAAAGTGVRLSDGSTNVLPVGDDAAVERGWALHHRLVTRSLERAFYQGWDLHPAQLPTRYAATFAFHRRHLDASLVRLRDFVGGAEGAVLDEPATARALADSVLRALDCGAATAEEVEAGSGLDAAALGRLARRVTYSPA
jgi:citrate lyase beta subunit